MIGLSVLMTLAAAIAATREERRHQAFHLEFQARNGSVLVLGQSSLMIHRKLLRDELTQVLNGSAILAKEAVRNHRLNVEEIHGHPPVVAGWELLPWADLKWAAFSRWGLTKEGWPAERPADARPGRARVNGHFVEAWVDPNTQGAYQRLLHLVRRSGPPLVLDLKDFAGVERLLMPALAERLPLIVGPGLDDHWAVPCRCGQPWPEGESLPPCPAMSLAEARDAKHFRRHEL